MPTETTLRIDFNIEQAGLDVQGGEYIYPSMGDYITFGQWFKGDKGETGEGADIEYATNAEIDALFD